MTTGNLDSSWPRIAKAVSRLGGDTDAERLAALGGVDRLLAAYGLTYLDLAARVVASVASPPLDSDQQSSFGDLARAVRDLDRGQLSPRERKFANDMCALGWRFAPSSRQVEWMVALFGRLSKERAAA